MVLPKPKAPPRARPPSFALSLLLSTMASIAIAARAYQQSFDTHPYATLALTNATLSAIGDGVAQITQIRFMKPNPHEDKPSYDVNRTLRFFTFGLGMGPILARWNRFLELRFPLRSAMSHPPYSHATTNAMTKTKVMGGVSAKAVIKRVAADQLFMAPIGLTLFLGTMGLMEGRDFPHIRRKFTDLYQSALLANWQVWPLAQAINFSLMPLPYRVPFQSTLGIFWNLYLSLLNASDNNKQSRSETMRHTVDED